MQYRTFSLLEFQAAFASTIGDRFDPAVVPVPVAVEHDRLDPFGLGQFGDLLADLLGDAVLLSLSAIDLHRFGVRRNADQRDPLLVVDDLHDDVVERLRRRSGAGTSAVP